MAPLPTWRSLLVWSFCLSTHNFQNSFECMNSSLHFSILVFGFFWHTTQCERIYALMHSKYLVCTREVCDLGTHPWSNYSTSLNVSLNNHVRLKKEAKQSQNVVSYPFPSLKIVQNIFAPSDLVRRGGGGVRGGGSNTPTSQRGSNYSEQHMQTVRCWDTAVSLHSKYYVAAALHCLKCHINI